MISKEDRMYFIDPLQPTTVRKTRADGTDLALQIVALRYRRDSWKQDRLGTIVPVTYQRVENQELWWVDEEGDHVYGAQVVDRLQGRTNVMAIVNDDLFYIGRNGGEHHNGGTVLTDAKRSDGKRLPGMNGTAFSYIAQNVVKAADWAGELMPEVGDTEEVVAAKVARAKQRYIQRHKKGEIYKEGMRRDWLHHLETLRADHDMPEPTFNVGIEGTFLTSGAEEVALEDLSPVQRDRLSGNRLGGIIRPNSAPREGYAHRFVGTQFAVVTSLTANNLAGVNAATTSEVRYSVFDALRVHSGHVLESNRFPILTGF